MRVVVTGDFREATLLDTERATGLVIMSAEGKPNVLYRFVAGGKGWIRYTKGEDDNFDEIARQLGFE